MRRKNNSTELVPESNKKRAENLEKQVFSAPFYGDEGNRTPVRNSSHRTSTSVVTVLTFPPPNTQ